MANMELLVLNLAGEMALVLDAQLRGKKAPRARRLRVLRELLGALHAALQRPPDARLISARAARGLLARIANAPPALSVDARAMDTLYGAARRGLQRALVRRDPGAVLPLTLERLEQCRRVAEADDASDVDREDARRAGLLVDEMVVRVYETYSELSVGAWYLMRQRLLGVLQEPTGTTASVPPLDAREEEEESTVGSSCLTRIVVRYFDETQQVCEQHTLDAAPHSRGFCGSFEGPSIDAIVANATKRLRPHGCEEKETASPPRAFNATASDALELLAGLLGSQSEAKASGWTFSLFEEDEQDEEKAVARVTIDARSERKETDAIRDEWGQLTAKSGAKHDEDEEDEDLLRLLDVSAKR